MQVTTTLAAHGVAFSSPPADLRAATAALNARTDAVNVASQLKTYQALAGRWSEAGRTERAVLAPALTGSRFALRIQGTRNTLMREAWEGPDAEPPTPQLQMLKAFDQLSLVDRQIVAAMQPGKRGAPSFASPSQYRDRLHESADKAQSDDALKRSSADTVTLSPAAEARLAGDSSAPREPAPTAEAVDASVAAALAAFAKVAG